MRVGRKTSAFLALCIRSRKLKTNDTQKYNVGLNIYFIYTMYEKVAMYNGVLGYDSAYTGPGTTWDNVMNFGRNHAPGAGSITWPVDIQSSKLPLC